MIILSQPKVAYYRHKSANYGFFMRDIAALCQFQVLAALKEGVE